MKLFPVLVIVLAWVTGCATQSSKYEWGNYNNDLYKYYARSINQDELIVHIKSIVQEGETQGKAVAPGMCAEYAYLLYERGQYNDALGFFQKEHDKWPESRVLMVKMIRNCKAKLNPPAPTGEPTTDKEPSSNEKTN